MTTPLIRQLTLQNFLSYGPEGVMVDLLPLNVLIGPNASGKSNLLEALSILRATAGDLQAAVREGGGVGEYLWKGSENVHPTVLRAVVQIGVPRSGYLDLSYGITLGRVGTHLNVQAEIIAPDVPHEVRQKIPARFQSLYSNIEGMAHFDTLDGVRAVSDLKTGQSILSQRRDPENYPALTYLAERFGDIALFQEWNFGRRTPARLPQPTDLPSDFLQADAGNLGLVLHDISQTSANREELIAYLRRFYEPARYVATKIQGGTLQLFIEEEGGKLIPATRLSDGTLRYLSLLAILCHPNPPPVIGIEEPELGLHPDIMPTIAELLKKASERTQLFVTTHSDALVSALSDTSESILVCESMPNGTTIDRLDPEKLREWLAEYSLGAIWRMGEIGGNRW